MIRSEATLGDDPETRVEADETPCRRGPGPRVLGIAVAIIGVTNLWRGDFTIVYHPMPDLLPARAIVAASCNAGLLATGLAISLGRLRHVGAPVLTALLLFLSLGWMVRVAMFPALIGTWLGLAEQWALAIGALAICATARAAPAGMAAFCRIGFGLCQLVFALGHFLSLPETIAMTPSYLPPGPRFWALATGALHLAGGILLVAAIRPFLVTRALGAMFAIFGLMVWLPMLFAGPTPAAWAGNLINLALVGAVLAVGDALAAGPRRRGMH